MSLRHTHDRYRAAVNASRDDTLPSDARERAVDEMVAMRHELDDALVGSLEPNGVSRDRFNAIIAGQSGSASGATSDAEIRSLLDPENPRCIMNLTEARAGEEWWKDTGGTTKAGYTVPTTVLGRVVYHINAQSGIFDAAYKLNTSTGEDITVPTLVTDATANLTAETVASTATDPVFGSETLKSYRLDGHFILSDELIRDSAVDVQRIVGDAAGRAIATKLASYLSSGSGSGEPEGITVGGTSALTAASQTALTLDEVKTLFYSVPVAARTGGVFAAGSGATLQLAQMKDADGNYIWSPAVSAGEAPTLFGKPYREDASMPACTAGLKPLAFGDLSNYFWIRMVTRSQNGGGIQLDFSQDVGFTSFLTYARWACWIDSRVMGNGGEIQYITMAA